MVADGGRNVTPSWLNVYYTLELMVCYSSYHHASFYLLLNHYDHGSLSIFYTCTCLLLGFQILTPHKFLLCLPPPPALVCPRAAVATLSAAVPVSQHLSSHLLCTCFHSINFIFSSFIAQGFALFSSSL